jgi:hypothetical protein
VLFRAIDKHQLVGSEQPLYREVMSQYAQLDAYADEIVDSIDPAIQALQGCLVTAQVLDEIRKSQNAPSSDDVGCLVYITDRRCHQYPRLYVGQTIRSWRRILVEHVQAILRGNVSSLHYFILWLGNGYRSANFLRLWTLPTGKDDRWRQATTNILECLFVRVLRSHHGTCSPKDAQLDPNPLLDGYGLNIMSPLLQRHALKDGDTIPFVMPTTRSPDPQIRLWNDFGRPRRKRIAREPCTNWTDADCIQALENAIDSEGCMADINESMQLAPTTPDTLPDSFTPFMVSFPWDRSYPKADCQRQSPLSWTLLSRLPKISSAGKHNRRNSRRYPGYWTSPALLSKMR